MKKSYLKILLLFLVLSIVVCGCGSKDSNESTSGSKGLFGKKVITCTKEESDEDGYKTNYTMEVTVKSDKVKEVEYLTISETDPQYIELSINVGTAIAEKLNTVNGIDAKYEKASENTIKYTMKIDYSKVKPEDVKEALGDLYSDDDAGIYNGNDITFDEFKESNLEGYTCK